MNRDAFFTAVRRSLFGGALSQSQVDGLGSLLTAWDKRGGGWRRELAYCLATATWETDHKMQPIEEYGKGKGKAYGKPGKHGGQIAYGRGYVQLTWDYNYAKADAELGLKGALTGNYDLALRPDIAADVLFVGMANGWFTGKKLSDYIDGIKCDYVNARRIVNGTDKAATIANYARNFEAALKAGEQTPHEPESPPRQPDDPGVESVQPAPQGGFFAAIVALLKALFGH